jgi:hypothetical protein
VAAKYSLAHVQEAAREGNVEFDEASALHKTSPFFSTFLEFHQFARDVLLSLRADDWKKSVELGPPHDGWYDVYEKQLDQATCQAHGVPAEWYLKLKLNEGLFGQSVFFVSFHQPEHAFKKPGTGKKKQGGQS